MLRIDPRHRPRLMEIIHNLTERIADIWHGEVEGLRVSQEAAQAKLSALDRGRSVPAPSITDLGLPILRS
jgi:hypothetical protein